MSKVNSFLERNVMPVAGKLAEQRHLQALRDGLILAMPLIIIGSLFLILAYLPIPAYESFMTANPDIRNMILVPYQATYGIMALVATFGIAYRLAERYNVDPLASGAIALAGYFVVTPLGVDFLPEGSAQAIHVTEVLSTNYMGSKGLFVGMLVAMLSTEVYRWIIGRKMVINLPDGVPPAVSRSFIALIPGFFVIFVMFGIRIVFDLSSFGNLHNVISQLLQEPLKHLGATLPGTLICIMLISLLWSTGLHGSTIVDSVMTPIWLDLMSDNAEAFRAGKELPHVVTDQFFDIWIKLGGSGTTLSLALAMVFFSKSQQMKQLGRLAVGPGFFNINEPIIFGMPIVLNPLLILPFILAPLAATTATYLAMDFGWVAKPAGIALPWTIPPIIGGYLATGGKISGAVMQLVNIGISLMIYFPFFKMWDKQKLMEENAAVESVEEVVMQAEEKTALKG
ncbi:PTS cellobiose transporter subunit IIC [Bacillus gobiensis]|uniref:PTS cellobiose transporter subunit IIC n=1 Tax=Bacillus gobiensis TaxID=1441095 RepID=UPI003D1DC8FF